ncbi:hypothetical protein A2363_05180 [Candidatus Gottesmanbacteria bacterium RIFOXYB1_FULL_47_11]|uniref:Nucleotidyl transferase AbiEii/AbiGii toxin family protein n=1 Tax=Candidatus Gottesmanbacteria bacterium RIFOXYB1_FULL_47_11 TaxID=1798401 RepID=A0A1F6BFB9_9BACT|nr:MAG: hypothetical protein A2363_05180 [Candidatus Gottesmanbacteria bacterium RIFOXYB1_FULL_47_11]
MGNTLTILTPKQQQILAYLARDPIVIQHFYLTGGTALSAYYLGNRDSEDLDFFSIREIDTSWLPVLAKSLKKQTGADSYTMEQHFNRNLLFFQYKKTVLKTEFTYFPFTQVCPPTRKRGLAVDSLKDIAVNKLFTIYQKPASRHFIDLYCICKKTGWKPADLTRLARIKFDTNIDPLLLAAQYMTADSMKDLPHMRIPLDKPIWVRWFTAEAQKLKKDIVTGSGKPPAQ